MRLSKGGKSVVALLDYGVLGYGVGICLLIIYDIQRTYESPNQT